jgi:ankyrin repeat protein
MQGADPCARDVEGRIPLHHAVMRGHLEVVGILMEAGPPAMLLSKDVLGCTPIHLAAIQNQVTLILQLVAALLKDVEGTTPIHEIARRNCLQVKMNPLRGVGGGKVSVGCEMHHTRAPTICQALSHFTFRLG